MATRPLVVRACEEVCPVMSYPASNVGEQLRRNSCFHYCTRRFSVDSAAVVDNPTEQPETLNSAQHTQARATLRTLVTRIIHLEARNPTSLRNPSASNQCISS